MIKKVVLISIFILLFGTVLLSGCIKKTSKLNENGGIEIIQIPTNNMNEPIDEFKNCAEEGEQFSEVYTEDYPETCCEGLTNWESGMDTSISIADECYATGAMAGSPVGTCINCGNGICEDIEGVCSCSEDCSGKNKSDFLSIEDFCQSESWNRTFSNVCINEINGFPICDLCTSA